MNDNQLAKIAKNENQTLPGYLGGLQNVGARVGRPEAHWIKYRTWSYKKMIKKKAKELV